MGDGRLQLVPERRAARKKFRPAACGELQTTAKPRTVDRVSGGQFARSPRRSRVHAEYRARGARPASSHRVNRPPGADWSPRAASPPAARQLPRGQRRWPRRSGRPHWERARARACRLAAGASRPSRGEAAAAVELENPNWHALSPLRLLGGGWRAAHPLTLTPTLTLFLFLTPFPDPDPKPNPRPSPKNPTPTLAPTLTLTLTRYCAWSSGNSMCCSARR